MAYAMEEYGIQVLNDIPVCCSNCKCRFFITADSITREESYDRAPMGTRINYAFHSISSCPTCGQEVEYEQEASEYPAGAVESIYYPNCFGAEIILLPEVAIPVYDEELYVSDDPAYSRYSSAEPEVLELGCKLCIDIEDGDAYLGTQLYIPNRRTTLWLNPAGRLLPILIEETGSIRFDDNRAVFAEVIQTNPKIGAMRLLGKVAEAVIVRNCNENAQLNRLWLSKARRNRTIQRTADTFRPIGTGLHSTKRDNPQKYNPSDPQRDIIWINDRGEYALVSGGQITTGIPAGLQVKVSGNGINYILRALINRRYEVPLVYFPMNNDYDRILAMANRDNIVIEPDVDFINVRNVDENAFFEICDYYPLLLDLFAGKLSGEDFIREASGISPIRNGILATALSLPKSEIRIIH